MGPWTVRKLEYLRDYLRAFAGATRSISDRGGTVAYLDLMAGYGRVRDRQSGAVSDGSAAVAMSMYPRINRFVLGDKERGCTASLLRIAQARGLNRNTTVLTGDCNQTVRDALRSVPRAQGAAFAFLDPEALELDWATVAQIARHKQAAPYKVEVFILFPFNMAINRLLVEERSIDDLWPGARARIDRVMPEPWRWRALYAALLRGELPRGDLRRRFFYLYWHGLVDLGYRHVAPPKLFRTTPGTPLYAMFFASDHDAGDAIMRYVLHRQPRLGEALPLPVLEAPYAFADQEGWFRDMTPLPDPGAR